MRLLTGTTVKGDPLPSVERNVQLEFEGSFVLSLKELTPNAEGVANCSPGLELVNAFGVFRLLKRGLDNRLNVVVGKQLIKLGQIFIQDLV
jgi:hypothetical protein